MAGRLHLLSTKWRQQRDQHYGLSSGVSEASVEVLSLEFDAPGALTTSDLLGPLMLSLEEGLSSSKETKQVNLPHEKTLWGKKKRHHKHS